MYSNRPPRLMATHMYLHMYMRVPIYMHLLGRLAQAVISPRRLMASPSPPPAVTGPTATAALLAKGSLAI